MTNIMGMIIEAVVVSFCMGGALGAVVTMHFQHKRNKVESSEFADHSLTPVEVRFNTRRFK